MNEKPRFLYVLPLILLLIAGTLSCSPPESAPAPEPEAQDEDAAPSPEPPPPSGLKAEHEQAVAEIKKLGGKVRVDENGSMAVYLNGTDITDAGLVHIEGLTDVEVIDLDSTKITDAGLEHVEGLSKLRMLNLRGTSVTDAGLQHLEGLTGLSSLELSATKVTKEGVEKLKQSLPHCDILHFGYR